MEIIDWVENEAKGSWDNPNLVAYCLLEAMSKKAGGDVKNVFSPFKPEALEVEFKVNGVDVEFTWICEVISKHLQGIEKEVKDKMKLEVLQKVQDQISHYIWESERN